MKEASRIQAVIEVLSEVFKNHLPADIVMDKYLKERRYIGSKDRRFICDTCWQIIRHRLSLSEKVGGTDSVRLVVAKYLIENGNDIDLLFNGEEYAPALLTAEEKKILTTSVPENLSEEAFYETPHWLIEKFDNKHLLEALNGVAPLDVRANLTSREQAKERLKKEGLFFSFTPYSPLGLRSEDRINLNNCMTYQDGEIEVMDEASQLLALLCRVKAHHKIMDYCAGAGGKALCMGAELHNEGVVYAHDISQERLSRIKKRAERLDILNIKICPIVTDEDYDRFIIDAPCSGSGTWRRSPDAKFRLTPQKLKDIQVTQADLLEFGAKHTKSGGRLIYMTCSVFKEENEAQIETFLAKHPEFTLLNHRELWQNTLDMSFYPFESEKYLHFTPLNTKTDGFFFCAMIKM